MAQVFRPIQSIRMDCSTTSKRVALPANTINIRIYNEAPVVAWVVIGNSSVTSAIPALDTAGAGFAIAPYTVENFTESPDGGATHIAAILSSGTGVVNVTCGEGW
jgi:hypothetical protein